MADKLHNIMLSKKECNIIVKCIHFYCTSAVDEDALDLLREMQDTVAFMDEE